MFTRMLSVLLLALTIAGCGGGGGGGSEGSGNNSPPSSSVPSSQDTAQAGAASLTASVDNASSAVTLSWNDTVTGTTKYTVQSQSASGTWTDVTTVTGSGSGNKLTWSGPVGSSKAFRVQATFTGYAVSLSTSAQQDHVTIVAPTSPATIELSATEPVVGQITATIGGGGTYTSVEYYLDLALVDKSTSGPTYPVSFFAGGTAPSSHLLLVRLFTSPDTAVEVRRTVQFAGVTPVFRIDGASEVQGDQLVVKASTQNASGNVTITADVDGTSLGTLTATNYVGTVGPGYRWTKPARDFLSGNRVVTLNATDGSGAHATWTLTVPVNNAPLLTLDSPFDGMLAYGSLPYQYVGSTDKVPAATTFVLKVGNLEIVNTTQASLSGSYNINGLAAGSYPFEAKLTDSTGTSVTKTGTIYVASSAPLAYLPLARMGSGSELIAVGANRTAVLKGNDGKFLLVTGFGLHVLDTDGIFTTNLKEWKVENGNVFAIGQIDNGGSTGFNLFQWDANGARTDRGSVTTQRIYAAHWPWVLVDGAPFKFVKATDGTVVTTSAQSGGSANTVADFYNAAGPELIAYFDKTHEVYRWNQSNDQVTLVASTINADESGPMTDGTRVVWRASPTASSNPFTLRQLDIASSTQTNVATDATIYNLQSGLLLWSIAPPASNLLRLSDGNTIANFIGIPGGVGDGFMLIGDTGKVYATDMSGALRTLVDTFPTSKMPVAGNTAYFMLGDQEKVLYGVLNP